MPRRLSLAFAAFLAVGIALASWRFLALGLSASFPDMAAHIELSRLAFLAHVSAAPLALALATFQLMPGLRARLPGLHRWSGRLYALAIVTAALGALGMSATDNGGWPAQLGFGLLATLWIGTTLNGVRLAMAGRLAEHRRWMIRSFALTFAAVTLRLYLPIMMASGMSYQQAIPILAWLCWLPNLALAEWALRRRPAPALAA